MRELTSRELQLVAGGRYSCDFDDAYNAYAGIVNPGSVGLPGYIGREPVEHVVQTGTPDACYAVLERRATTWNVTFRYVPYDPRPMAELARKHNMPAWANALETGWIGSADEST